VYHSSRVDSRACDFQIDHKHEAETADYEPKLRKFDRRERSLYAWKPIVKGKRNSSFRPWARQANDSFRSALCYRCCSEPSEGIVATFAKVYVGEPERPESDGRPGKLIDHLLDNCLGCRRR
jgi:hypothetical protein